MFYDLCLVFCNRYRTYIFCKRQSFQIITIDPQMDEYIHYTARQFKYSDGYIRHTTRRKCNTDGYIIDISLKRDKTVIMVNS